MRHNDMLELLGRCVCPCHPSNRRPSDETVTCWCRSGIPADDGLAMHHNDRVRFGACTCPHHRGGSGCCCSGPTSDAFATALRRLDARDAEKQQRMGRGAITEAIWHV
jgi:hypothetical protein